MNGKAQLARRVPHWVEARIVDFHQRPRLDVLAKIQSKRLQYLDTHGAGLLAARDFVRLPLRKAGFADAAIGRFDAVEEPALVALLQLSYVPFEKIAEAARQVNHGANIERVHPACNRIDLPEGFGHLRRTGDPPLGKNGGHVGMDVNHRELSPRGRMLWDRQHALWLEVFERQAGFGRRRCAPLRPRRRGPNDSRARCGAQKGTARGIKDAHNTRSIAHIRGPNQSRGRWGLPRVSGTAT